MADIAEKIFTLINDDSTYLILTRSYKKLNEGNLDIIYTIPSKRILFLEKFPLDTSGRNIRLVISYITEKNDNILEILNLDLEKRTISNVKKIPLRDGYVNNRINSNTIFYDEVWNKKIIKSMINDMEIPFMCGSLCGKNINDISIVPSCLNGDIPFKVILHVGSMEKIHILMVAPTKNNPCFGIHRKVYSELTDKTYDILDGANANDDYLSYSDVDFFDFFDLFNKTKCASEISEEIIKREKNIKEFSRVLSLRKK